MAKAKKVAEVVEEAPTAPVVEEVFVNNSNVTIHTDRWDGTVNTNEAPKLPSLDD